MTNERTFSMTMKPQDVYSYERQALDLLDKNHPHYQEIVELLNEQIKDELETYANSKPDKGAS